MTNSGTYWLKPPGVAKVLCACVNIRNNVVAESQFHCRLLRLIVTWTALGAGMLAILFANALVLSRGVCEAVSNFYFRWQMCYTSSGSIHMRSKRTQLCILEINLTSGVTADERSSNHSYPEDGYRSDCMNTDFNEIMCDIRGAYFVLVDGGR